MRNVLSELKSCLLSPVRWLVLIAAVAICSLSNPFNANMIIGPVLAVVFWAVILGVSIVLADTIRLTIGALDLGVKRPIEALIEGGLFAGIYATLLYFTNNYIYREAPKEALVPFWLLFMLPFSIYLLVAAIKYYVVQSPEAEEETAPFLNRLQPDLGQSIIRVSSQNHYVEVTTDAGSDMILMRFSDAIDELQGFDGIRVHRSHWVSRDAVKSTEKSNGKLVLKLKDGSTVPVSRSYREAAQGAGLI